MPRSPLPRLAAGVAVLLLLLAVGSVLVHRGEIGGKRRLPAVDPERPGATEGAAAGGPRADEPAPGAAPAQARLPPQPNARPRTLIPRFVAAAGGPRADAGARSAAASVRLAPGKGPMTDKRPNPPPGSAAVMDAIKDRMGQTRVAIEACMRRWTASDPSLVEGVTLAFSLDAGGLDRVWIEGRGDVPSGHLQCLGEAVYQIDWSGLTPEPVQVTDKIRYDAPGGG
jgi:hypothetical protein